MRNARTRMNYPRRRAPVACNYCRYRKRKCDSQRPTCGLCSLSNIDCEYPESSDDNRQSARQNADNLPIDALLRRLDHLEDMMKRQTPREESQYQPTNSQQAPTSNSSVTDPACQHHRQSDHSSIIEENQHGPIQNEELGITQHTPPHTSPDRRTRTEDVSNHDEHADPIVPFENSYNECMLDSTQGFAGFLSSMGPHALPLVSNDYIWSMSNTTAFPTEISQRCGVCGRDDSRAQADAPITIPIGHHTSTGSLFALDPVRRLVGDYPRDFFYRVETRRPNIPELQSLHDLSMLLATLDFMGNSIDSLISNYFTHIHPNFPILDRETFTDFLHQTLRGTGHDDTDTALCLVVLALGKFTSSKLDRESSTSNSHGLEYFIPAYQILTTKWVASFNGGLSLATGLILSSIYLSCLARPLLAWRLVYMASSKLQMLVSSGDSESVNFSDSEENTTGRLFWACFLLECDNLAELHLPPSGIEIAIDRMQFPRFSSHDDRDGLMFLALCSVRRLLNRIHNAVYASGSQFPVQPPSSPSFAENDNSAASPALSTISSLECVLNELVRQLDTWYRSLPSIIKPDLSQSVPVDIHEAWLRLRYWSARHIISRPCLVYITSAATMEDVPQYVLKYAEMCIESCRNYVRTSHYVLSHRNLYTWAVVQASLAAALVLTTASETPLLQHLVPDAEDIISKLIISIECQASPESSIESVVWILRSIYQKQRLSKHNKSRGTPSTPASSSRLLRNGTRLNAAFS